MTEIVAVLRNTISTFTSVHLNPLTFGFAY